MQLRTQCPACQKILRCPAERMGTIARCPACRHKFRLESLASGGEASSESQPSMEAMQTLEQMPAGGTPQASEQASQSRASGESQASGSQDSRPEASMSGASRSVSKGGQKRAEVASLPSLGRFGDYD